MEAPLSPPLKPPPERREQRRRSAGGWPGIPIGRLFGLDIRIDTSWLIIFALVALSMFSSFSQSFPDLSSGAAWAAALGTSLIFFVCLLLHEISHSVVARHKGVEVAGITLFMFGGVSQIRQEPQRPSDEFVIAVVGPVTSAMLGVFFLALRTAFLPDSVTYDASSWLGRINIALAVFNLLPGLPLDGGRMLRAAIWGATRDLRRATRIASFMGSVLAFGLVGWGILEVLWNRRFIDGLWLGLIGWFLLVASRQSVSQVELKENLRRLRVRQAMRSSCPEVSFHLPVAQFVDEYIFRRGGKCFFVTDDDGLRGIVTLDDIRRLDRDEWPNTTVGDIMIPLAEVKSVESSDSLLVAFERMNEHSLNQLPVVDDGRAAGILTRNDIFRLVARFLELTEQPGGGP
jgi:Zn-dependent protease/predicted transcriptional regulator